MGYWDPFSSSALFGTNGCSDSGQSHIYIYIYIYICIMYSMYIDCIYLYTLYILRSFTLWSDRIQNPANPFRRGLVAHPDTANFQSKNL